MGFYSNNKTQLKYKSFTLFVENSEWKALIFIMLMFWIAVFRFQEN